MESNFKKIVMNKCDKDKTIQLQFFGDWSEFRGEGKIYNSGAIWFISDGYPQLYEDNCVYLPGTNSDRDNNKTCQRVYSPEDYIEMIKAIKDFCQKFNIILTGNAKWVVRMKT